ncbi:MAG: FlgD immunoglobulin-like domain containing protein [Ignavibacteria bacterium]|jgi:hypothetical protein
MIFLKLKSFIFSAVLFLLMFNPSNAQTTTEKTPTLNKAIVKYKASRDASTYSYGSGLLKSSNGQYILFYSIGHMDSIFTDAEKELTYRTILGFNISDIPQGSTLLEAKLKIDIDRVYQVTSTAKIKDMGTSISLFDNEDEYNNIGSGSTLNSSVSTGGTLTEVTLSGLTDTFDEALYGSKKIYLGVMSNNESSHETICDISSVTLVIKYEFRQILHIGVENNFSGGQVYSSTSGNKTAPYNIYPDAGQSLTLGAIENQTDENGYIRIWNDTEAPDNKSIWQRRKGTDIYDRSDDQNYTFVTSLDDDNSTYIANLRKKCDITLQNSFSGGVITVNGTERSSPYTEEDVIELNDVEVSVSSTTTVNYIDYTFQNWSDGSTTYSGRSQTFNPSAHTTYTANYIGTVNNSYRNMRDTGILWDFIVIEWDEHPNTDVTHYKVYRRVKHDGVMGDEVLVATKPRGSTSYTDSYYVKAKTYVDLVQYDVRGYYSPDGTYPDADYFAVYGEPCLPKENDTTAVENEIVNEFALANYPNPFNPSTNINFSIPKAQNVKLLIYNILGEKVKELVNSNMEAGSYTVQWNGDNQSGRKVNSGVYFSVLQTQEKRIVKKMILSK